MQLSPLTALSPLDGRYRTQTHHWSNCLSEQAFIEQRVLIEVVWLESLANHPDIPEIPPLTHDARNTLYEIVDHFSQEHALRIKDIERTCNHDVKAVEYFIREHCEQHDALRPYCAFIHFACTSDDINNLAYALLLKSLRTRFLNRALETLLDILGDIRHAYDELPMLSRTHGQAATPTTLGKEIANTMVRLRKQLDKLNQIQIFGKLNGAVGNYNAHLVCYPNIDWLAHTQQVVESLGLSFQTYTTQIEPHDYIAELCDCTARINTILIDFAQDIWGYVSLGYFRQRLKQDEVGSSTMPHKVNPIDFENAEGNLGIANALHKHFASKLPISRWQRDLSDSTVMRNVGVAFAHSLLAYRSLCEGLEKLNVDEACIQADLEANWMVLAEAIQTVMRQHGIPNAYEQLKTLTRGQVVDAKTLRTFLDTLPLPSDIIESLSKLTPQTYIGLASVLAARY